MFTVWIDFPFGLQVHNLISIKINKLTHPSNGHDMMVSVYACVMDKNIVLKKKTVSFAK